MTTTELALPVEAPATGLRLHAMGLRRMRALGLFAALWWFAALVLWHRNVMMDDPWITFQYARNLLEGNGLVFNVGEAVEGYSNFTWVLLSTIPIALGVEPLGAMRALSVACCALIFVWLTFRIPADAEDDGDGGGFAAPLMLASCYPFAIWAMGGLETSFYALLLFASVVLFGRIAKEDAPAWQPAAAGGVLALLAMTRPEGAMFVLLPIVQLALALKRGARTEALRIVGALTLFAAIFGGYLAFRYSLYGSFVPNSVTAKVGAGISASMIAGKGYLGGYFWGAPALLGVAFVWGTYRLLRHGEIRATDRPLLLLAAGGTLLQLAFILGVGGDWMPGYRFLAPVLPLMCLVAAHGIERVPVFARAMAVTFLLLAAPIETSFDAGGGPAVGVRIARWLCDKKPLVQPLINIGTELRVMGRPGDAIAMSEAGVVPYISRLRVIDMLGLMDPEIAKLPGGLHQKFDADLVLRRKPRFILIGKIVIDGEELITWDSDRQMMASPDFHAHYSEVRRWPRFMTDSTKGPRRDGFMVLFERNAP
jgi:arabinofuranosyltransferase